MNNDIPGNDISSLMESSILKSRLDGEIYLDSPDLTQIEIPSRFKKEILSLPKNNYNSEIRKIVEPISEEVEKLGFGGNVFTSLYEALKNAHEHGNLSSPKKNIILASNINPQNLEFIICDQGKKLHPKFTRFILELREKDLINGGFINWYEFSAEKPKPGRDNNGTGTSFMHVYVDRIRYFKSDDLGGLAVYMRKNRK